jgi:hypothetical protein
MARDDGTTNKLIRVSCLQFQPSPYEPVDRSGRVLNGVKVKPGFRYNTRPTPSPSRHVNRQRC